MEKLKILLDKILDSLIEMWPVIWSAFKDMLRNVLIAVIPELINRISGLNWDPTISLAISVALKFIDATLHKYGKVVGDDSLKLGILRF